MLPPPSKILNSPVYFDDVPASGTDDQWTENDKNEDHMEEDHYITEKPP